MHRVANMNRESKRSNTNDRTNEMIEKSMNCDSRVTTIKARDFYEFFLDQLLITRDHSFLACKYSFNKYRNIYRNIKYRNPNYVELQLFGM